MPSSTTITRIPVTLIPGDGIGPEIVETLASIRRTGLALKGPLTTPVGGGFRSVNVRMREEFQLFANVRPARTMMPGGRYENIDVVVVRENLEGFYVGFEHYISIAGDPHAVAIGCGVNSRASSERSRNPSGVCRLASKGSIPGA